MMKICDRYMYRYLTGLNKSMIMIMWHAGVVKVQRAAGA